MLNGFAHAADTPPENLATSPCPTSQSRTDLPGPLADVPGMIALSRSFDDPMLMLKTRTASFRSFQLHKDH
jgi:hypothetical protein